VATPSYIKCPSNKACSSRSTCPFSSGSSQKFPSLYQEFRNICLELKVIYNSILLFSRKICLALLICLLSCTTGTIENLDSSCSWEDKPGEGPCKACVCHNGEWICSDPVCSWSIPVNQPFCVPGCVEDLFVDTAQVENSCHIEVSSNGQLWQAPECLRDTQGNYVLTHEQYTLPTPLVPACVAYLGDSDNFSPSPQDDLPSSCQQDENLGLFVFVDSQIPTTKSVLRDCGWSSTPEQTCAIPSMH